MHLKGLHSGNKFEFPIASTLTHKTNTNTQKEQKLITAGQKQRVKFNNFLYFFKQRFLLLKTNNVKMERQGIMTTCVMVIYPANTKPKITVWES